MCFLMFSGGIEKDQWHEMGEILETKNKDRIKKSPTLFLFSLFSF